MTLNCVGILLWKKRARASAELCCLQVWSVVERGSPVATKGPTQLGSVPPSPETLLSPSGAPAGVSPQPLKVRGLPQGRAQPPEHHSPELEVPTGSGWRCSEELTCPKGTERPRREGQGGQQTEEPGLGRKVPEGDVGLRTPPAARTVQTEGTPALGQWSPVGTHLLCARRRPRSVARGLIAAPPASGWARPLFWAPGGPGNEALAQRPPRLRYVQDAPAETQPLYESAGVSEGNWVLRLPSVVFACTRRSKLTVAGGNPSVAYLAPFPELLASPPSFPLRLFLFANSLSSWSLLVI